MEQLKKCTKCGRMLPLECFRKDKRRKDGLFCYCKSCEAEYFKEYYNNTKEERKKYRDKTKNTFGRNCGRGNRGILKRDYELTEKQLKRRNYARKLNTSKKVSDKVHGVLIWYDGKLNDVDTKTYVKAMIMEYNRQRSCAIRGYIGRKNPSEHFLFDFDLEQMLKDNCYTISGKERKYIEKWWEGEIRHWTVNDGVWKK